MGIRELETFYESSLRPVFGAQLRIIHERNDFVHIILDGEKEDFFFTLYGIGCVRLYWCNECFIFDQQRNNLVSSDTFGEIVFEGKIDVQKLPQTIVDLVLQLRNIFMQPFHKFNCYNYIRLTEYMLEEIEEALFGSSRSFLAVQRLAG